MRIHLELSGSEITDVLEGLEIKKHQIEVSQEHITDTSLQNFASRRVKEIGTLINEIKDRIK